MARARTVLRLSGIVKTFPGVVALNGVTLDVVEGEVHALVGENGAGKSTLIAVAAGATLPDSGTVEIDRQEIRAPSPVASQALGLAVVYQHQSIVRDLTVVENLYFSMPSGRRPSWSGATTWARKQLTDVGAAVDPSARVGELSILERQLVEIAKALALQPKVILFDEPTEALTAAETELLFDRIRQIKQRGTAVVYISHRLPDVLLLADRLTILRDGETRGTFQAGDLSESDVLRLMVGRPIVHAFPDKRRAPTPEDVPILEVSGLSGTGFQGVDLDVRPGEIVGLAGIEGNGQRELIRALAGLEPVSRGEVRVRGETVRLRNARSASANGVVHMPGDRHEEGLFLTLSVRENASLLALQEVSRVGVLSRKKEQALVASQTRQLSIKTPSDTTTVELLSGGNQQKVLFARALASDPVVLLADEPTRGVDAGARIELYRILRAAAAAGKAVVVLSSDAIELQGLCDRVLVFSRGQVVRRLEGDEIAEANITGAAVTATGRRAETATRTRQLQRFRRMVKGDYAPALVILLAIIALGAYTAHSNDLFLSARSVENMLFLGSALIVISAGQLVVLLTGGLDLSVGPLAGLVAVILSLYLHEGSGAVSYALALAAAFGCAFAVGLVNYVLASVLELGPVLATASMLIVLQGISLLLRPSPGGSIDSGFVAAMHTSAGRIPAIFIGAAVVCVAAEIVLRRTHHGIGVRAVGSDATLAHRLGAHVALTRCSAYIICALFAFLGGLMLTAQIGIGDASAGGSYSLTSITAVVLGGASIYGGRGSFIGALLGALLIQESITSTAFLGFGLEWQYWLPGILILVSACAYSIARRAHGMRLGIA